MLEQLCGIGTKIDWQAAGTVVALISALVAFATYWNYRESSELAFVHQTFRDFLKLDYELRCGSLPDIRQSRSIKNGKVDYSAAPEEADIKKALNSATGAHRRLVSIKLYTMEEIYLWANKRRNRLWHRLLFTPFRIFHTKISGKSYISPEEYWINTCKTHILDDAIVGCRELDIYKDCYSHGFYEFCMSKSLIRN